MRFIRRGGYKYVHVLDCEPLLFDLGADPNETANIAGRTESASVQKELHDELMRGYDPQDLRRRIMHSQQERLLISRSLQKGATRSWDFDPFGKFPL